MTPKARTTLEMPMALYTRVLEAAGPRESMASTIRRLLIEALDAHDDKETE